MKGYLKKGLGILALLTVLFANGLHIAALQAYAWSTMFVEYKQTLDTADAIEATFSGRELCGLCLASQDLQNDLDEALSDFLSMGQPLLILLLASIVLGAKSPRERRDFFSMFDLWIRGRKPVLDPPPPRILEC